MPFILAHRSSKPRIESPEPARKMNKQNIASTQKPINKSSVQTPKPQNPQVSIPSKIRSNSVPRRNQYPSEIPVHLTKAKQTNTSPGQKRTNDENIRTNKDSRTTEPKTNGSMIPKRLPISSSPKAPGTVSVTSPPEESRDSVDSIATMPMPVSKICDKVEATVKNEKGIETAGMINLEEDFLKNQLPDQSPMPLESCEIPTEDSRIIPEPRSPMILAAPADVIALRGATVTLLATFEGEPQPKVRWLRKVRFCAKKSLKRK